MHTTPVQYGECVYVDGGLKEMPEDIREKLRDRARAVSRALGYPIIKHDFMWAHGKSSPDDPLGQRGTAAIRYFLDVPSNVVNAQRDAKILSEGWVPYVDFNWPPPGDVTRHRVEIADFSFDGVPRRYARVRKEERA